LHVTANCLVRKLSVANVTIRYGIKTQQLAKRRERLNFCELRGGNICLKLQKLQFDFQKVAFAHVADFEAFFADVDGLLKAVEILLSESQRRLRKQCGNELLGDVENQLALAVGRLVTHDSRLVAGRLEAMLTLFAALEKIANAQVELRLIGEIVRVELVRMEEREEL